MKLFSSLLLILLIFSVVSNAQIKSKNDLEYNNIKGAVKSIVTDVYDVLDCNGKEQKIWKYSEVEFYNKAGNLIYSKSNNVNGNSIDSTFNIYDSLDNLIEEKHYDQFNLLSKQINTTYSVNGNFTSERELEYLKDDSGKIEDSIIIIDNYTYNELNLITEIWRTELKDDGTFSEPRLYIKNVYEDSGRVRLQYEYGITEHSQQVDTSYLRKNKDGKTLEEWNSQTHSMYTYDRLGKLIVSNNMLIKSTKILYTYIFEFDKWGNKTGTKTLDSNGKINGIDVKSDYYNIDKKGNWGEVKSFKNGIFTTFWKRVIKYY